MNKAIAALLLAAPLSACATTSFAPPPVNPQLKANVNGKSGCLPGTFGAEIPANVDGAMTLVDNYIFSYRCAERELANGRRYFQIPSFFAAVGGLIGPTLGLSNDGVLLAGTAAGVLNTGNAYFDPKAKAAMVGSATRALACIKTESTGISWYDTKKPKQEPKKAELLASLNRLRDQQSRLTPMVVQEPRLAADLLANLSTQNALVVAIADADLAAFREEATTGKVIVDAEVQYFNMVAAALYGVESILSERLRDAGTLDTADLFAKLKELAKAHTDAENKANEQKPKDPTTGGPKAFSQMTTDEKRLTVELENAVLQPKLQTCVLQTWA